MPIVSSKKVQFNNVYQLIDTFGREFVDQLGKNLDRRKDATGKLRESIKFRIKIFSEGYEFQLLMEDYWKWVDEGRKPGKGPPISPNVILKWMSYKPGLLNKVSSQKGFGKNKSAGKISTATNISKAKSLAFLINRKIAKQGIKPTYFFSNALNDGRVEKFKLKLSEALKKDVLVEIREI